MREQVTADSAVQQDGRRRIRRVSIASMIGTTLEYYDFSLYVPTAALVFGPLFFPTSSHWVSTLASYATLAVGFLARPFGAIILAHYGDRLGRKTTLIFTLLLMGCSTVAIGLLPTYQTIGIAAPILLVLLRLLQGFGTGAEFSGASLIVAEHATGQYRHHRGRYTGMTAAGTAVGSAIATLAFLAARQLPHQAAFSWGWRIPFLLSSVVLMVGLYIRSRVSESPVFEKVESELKEKVRLQRESSIPAREILREPEHRRRIILAFFANGAPFIMGYLGAGFGISYATAQLGVSSNVTLTCIVALHCLRAATIPLFAALSDKIGRRPMFIASAISMIVFAFPFFLLLNTRIPLLIFLGMYLAAGACNDFNLSCQGTYLSELYPTSVRFTGIVFSREFSAALLGGTVPFIATALVGLAHGSYVPVALFATFGGVIATIASWKLPETRDVVLEDIPTSLSEESGPDLR